MFCWAAGGAVNPARCSAAAPCFSAAVSHQSSFIWWIVALLAVSAFTMGAFVAVALRRTARGTTIVIVATVVDISTAIGAISTREQAMAAFAMAPKLVSSMMGATRVRRVANLAPNVVRRLTEQALFDTLELLAVERAVKLFLLVQHLKEGGD
jgi:hypothetical protein